MEKNEYFKEISLLAKQKREFSASEKVLIEEEVKEELEKIFAALHPSLDDKRIWENHFPLSDLREYIFIEIRTLHEKILKARKIYLTQQRIINNLSQLTID